MTEVEVKKPQESLQDYLARAVELLYHHKAVEGLIHRQEGQHHDRVGNPVHRRSLVELQHKLEGLHPADITRILEPLPLDDRLAVWQLVESEDDGDILLEVPDVVRETLIADMDDHEIIAATKNLGADELADLVPELLHDVVHELVESLDAQQRERMRLTLSYEKDQVGALMGFEVVTIREDVSLEVVPCYLCRLKELSKHIDKLFVISYDGALKGMLPIKRLLVNDPDKQVLEVMATGPVTLHPDEDGYDAAQASERYDLIPMPVADKGGELIDRLTIDEVVDLVREKNESEVLNMVGLREEEDISTSVWKSVRNRWAWLIINPITAFVASRVIGLFEDSIEELATLAALMSIVAGIGGNSDNQTITMIVCAITLDQVQPTSNGYNRLLHKELGVTPVNGLAWGGAVGVVAFYLYGNWELGVMITAAVTLNPLLAAMMGMLIPTTLHHFRRDPAMGSSVMITATTDSGGFFTFLDLAMIFLM